MSDKMRPVLICLLLTIPLFSGCFTSKNKRQEDKHITAQVEQSFKQRWIQQRSAELISEGQPADVALSLAVQEFRQRYEFTSAAQE